MNRFRNIESPAAPQRVRISWDMLTLPDDNPDVSWLEPDSGRYDDVEDEVLQRRCEEFAAQRLAAFKAGDWYMVGVVAEAHVFIPIGGNSFARHTFRSTGLWGVESDADKEYLREVFAEEKAELMVQLKTLSAAMQSGDFDEEDAE